MYGSNEYYSSEEARHQDLACRFLSPKEARYIVRKLCDLVRLPYPKLYITDMSDAGEYHPPSHTMRLDATQLSLLIIVHEFCHAMMLKSKQPAHGETHRLLVDAVAALTRIVG